MFCRWLFCLSILTLVSCASRPPAYQEQGWASYVADHYTGRMTSSGEIYYPQAYTAAHTSLPFGTVVTVKNVLNGRKVNVTVNDRFPYYPGRVINLSSVAAQQIGIPYMQMGQVELRADQVAGGAYGQQQQQHSAPPPYGGGNGGYQPQPAYQQQQSPYPSQPAYQSQPPANYNSQPQSGYQVQPPAGGAPNAPAYGGGYGTPSGLKTF